MDAMADGMDDFFNEAHDWLIAETIFKDEEKAVRTYRKTSNKPPPPSP